MRGRGSRFSTVVRRCGSVALVVGVVAALAAEAEAAVPSKTRCPKGKVTQIVNGKRTCVAPSRFGVTRQPDSMVTQRFRQMIGSLRPRGAERRPAVVRNASISPAMQRTATAGFAQMEAEYVAALTNARTAARIRETRTFADVAPTLSTNADGSVTARGSKTFDVAGESIGVDLGVTLKDGQFTFDVGVDYTDKKDGTRSRAGYILRGGGSSTPTCPSATGAIPLRSKAALTLSRSDVVGSARVKLGTIRYAMTGDFGIVADAQLNADAALEPVPFTASASFDYSYSLQGLAFLQSRYRIIGRGSMSGTIDPATGAVSDSTVRINSSSNGPDAAVRARGEADLRKALEKSLRDMAGTILKDAKTVETAARSGRCTTITLSPASANLPPRRTVNVAAKLATSAGVAVTTTKWTATPSVGSVSPTASAAAEPTFLVTGADIGPQTATIVVRAVSPAGISQSEWSGVGQGRSLPQFYDVTFTATNASPKKVEWTGTLRWKEATFTTAGPRLPGEIFDIAEYAVVGGTATYTVSGASGDCTFSGSATVTIPAETPATDADMRLSVRDLDALPIPGITHDSSAPIAYHGHFVIPQSVVVPPATETCFGVSSPTGVGFASLIGMTQGPFGQPFHRSYTASDPNLLEGSYTSTSGPLSFTWRIVGS